MKRFIVLCVVTSLLLTTPVTYAQNTTAGQKGKSKTGAIQMKGAYVMQRQAVDYGKGDSATNIQQLKMYTDRHMIYVHRVPDDSLAAYGIGTYEVKNGKVLEHVFYRSADSTQKNTYELTIQQRKDGYSQVLKVNDQGRTGMLTEDYKKVGNSVRTPLDGAWKQVRSETINAKGETVIENNPTQFKVFESGYFIWTRTFKDSATNRRVSVYGYGTFEMDGKSRAMELNTSSTFSNLVNVPVTLDLEFMGKDSYTQTILFPDGSKGIETFQRLK